MDIAGTFNMGVEDKSRHRARRVTRWPARVFADRDATPHNPHLFLDAVERHLRRRSRNLLAVRRRYFTFLHIFALFGSPCHRFLSRADRVHVSHNVEREHDAAAECGPPHDLEVLGRRRGPHHDQAAVRRLILQGAARPHGACALLTLPDRPVHVPLHRRLQLLHLIKDPSSHGRQQRRAGEPQCVPRGRVHSSALKCTQAAPI